MSRPFPDQLYGSQVVEQRFTKSIGTSVIANQFRTFEYKSRLIKRILPMTAHGGKRAGAGRPAGSTSISKELRKAAQSHTEEALAVLVDIMTNTEHPQRLKAAELILARGHGAAKEEPASVEIIHQFIEGKLSAIAACLMLEAEGLRVPNILRRYFENEMKIACHTPMHKVSRSMFDAPEPLPRS